MPLTLTLERYAPERLDGLHALVERVIRISYPPHYPPRAVEFFVHHHAREKIAADGANAFVLIALSQDRMVATGTLVGSSITRVFVDPEWQGKGAGRQIMAALEAEAVWRSIQRVVLDASLPAIRFYETLGYERLSDRSLDVGEGQMLLYCMMAKSLQTSASHAVRAQGS